METQLKQRLVGVIVIFSLAIIFLPMLLDGSGRRAPDMNIVIPPPPELNSDVRVEKKVIELKKKIESLDEPRPVIVDEISDPLEKQITSDPPKIAADDQSSSGTKTEPVKNVAPKALPDQTREEKVKSKKVVTKQQIGGDLWVIQVGSFQDKTKAYNERNRLRKANLSAVFIERYNAQNTVNYRVRMGPFITREKAKVIKNKVFAKYNIKGLVMKYEK